MPVHAERGELGRALTSASLNLSGLRFDSIEAHAALMSPVGIHDADLTAITAMVNRQCYALWVGQARYPFTSCKIRARVTTAYIAGGVGPYAQVGLASGDFDAEGAPTLTSRGTADVSAVYNAIGLYGTSVTVSGITAGMDVWITYGFRSTTTLPVLRGSLADDLQAGSFVSLPFMQPALLSGTLMSLDAATTVPARMRLATRG